MINSAHLCVLQICSPPWCATRIEFDLTDGYETRIGGPIHTTGHASADVCHTLFRFKFARLPYVFDYGGVHSHLLTRVIQADGDQLA